MAAPVDAGRAAYGGASSNIHAVTMPATVSAGDTLLMVFRVHNGTVDTGPSGFTPLVNNDATDASDDATSIFYKKADGSEGGTTVNVTLAGGLSRKASAITWRITGAADPTVTPPEVSTVATGTSTTPDPGNLAPSGGSKDYLWFWIGAWEQPLRGRLSAADGVVA